MKTLLTMVVATVLTAAQTTFADDLNPPSWRGQPGSTLQVWNFATDANPAAPSLLNNPFGTPSATIDYDPLFGTGWYDTMPDLYGSKQGWWDIATGTIAFDIPNSPATGPGSFKLLQLQVTYWKDLSLAPLVTLDPFGTPQGSVTTSLVEPGPVGGGWYSDTYLWELVPNPTGEQLLISGDPMWGSQIDQVVVDTICVVPEPSALVCLMLGLGTLWLAQRRSA